MPALHVFHQPIWLPTVVRNTVEDFAQIQSLQQLSDKIDGELKAQNAQKGITVNELGGATGQNMAHDLIEGKKSQFDDDHDHFNDNIVHDYEHLGLNARSGYNGIHESEIQENSGDEHGSFQYQNEGDSHSQNSIQQMQANAKMGLRGQSGQEISSNFQPVMSPDNYNPQMANFMGNFLGQLQNSPMLTQQDGESNAQAGGGDVPPMEGSVTEGPLGHFSQKITIGDPVPEPSYATHVQSITENGIPNVRFKQDAPSPQNQQQQDQLTAMQNLLKMPLNPQTLLQLEQQNPQLFLSTMAMMNPLALLTLQNQAQSLIQQSQNNGQPQQQGPAIVNGKFTASDANQLRFKSTIDPMSDKSNLGVAGGEILLEPKSAKKDENLLLPPSAQAVAKPVGEEQLVPKPTESKPTPEVIQAPKPTEAKPTPEVLLAPKTTEVKPVPDVLLAPKPNETKPVSEVLLAPKSTEAKPTPEVLLASKSDEASQNKTKDGEIESSLTQMPTNRTSVFLNKPDENSSNCTKKEGFLKVRDLDDDRLNGVSQHWVTLRFNQLTYFTDQNDRSTIQGSIDIKNIKVPLKKLKNMQNCFVLKMTNTKQKFAICSKKDEPADVIDGWLDAITKNNSCA